MEEDVAQCELESPFLRSWKIQRGHFISIGKDGGEDVSGDCLDDGAHAERIQSRWREGRRRMKKDLALHFWISSSSVTGQSFTGIRETERRSQS